MLRTLSSAIVPLALATVCSTARTLPAQNRPLDGRSYDITALVDSVRDQFRLPALGGAIVTLNEGVVAVGVAGTRRASERTPVTVGDKWHLGSDFKAFTALLAAIAVDRKQITWTTTVAESFPELRDSMPVAFREVTLRDVLSHQGGIPADPVGVVPGATQTERRNAVARWALTGKPRVPRGVFAYSNVGYIVAAAMLERALGTPFEDAMTAHVFAPIGITDAGFGPQAGKGSTSQPVAHRRVPGAGWRELEALDNQAVYSAAGGAHMSLESWAAFVRELLRVEAGTSTIVTPLNGRETMREHVRVGSTDRYGMGWIVTTRPWADGKALTHTGSNTANIAVAWVAPRRGVAFLVVANSFDATADALSANGADALVGRMVEWHVGRKPR